MAGHQADGLFRLVVASVRPGNPGNFWPSCAAAPAETTAIVQAILVLHRTDSNRYTG